MNDVSVEDNRLTRGRRGRSHSQPQEASKSCSLYCFVRLVQTRSGLPEPEPKNATMAAVAAAADGTPRRLVRLAVVGAGNRYGIERLSARYHRHF